MLMPNPPAPWISSCMAGRGESIRGKPLCCQRRQLCAAMNLSHAPGILPHRCSRKPLVQQHTRRSQRVEVGNKGGEAACGIFAIGPVKPDFVSLHGHPIHCSAHVRTSSGLPHCAMLTARGSFARCGHGENFAETLSVALRMTRKRGRLRILIAKINRAVCTADLPLRRAGRTK
jgi:hypothetical protein